MTARLTRLRIAGFKSFAEPATIDILPGLTGVVGPNGCGKSNVVEALRWAMGETSARSLRGGEMDDVIFAGTVARPSRNLAEVTITLEASPDAPLPAPFEQEAELQVTRRIERGAGSCFRAAGREMRARDVQTLFADLASGARSSGMVSQGRVAALVGAKPEERRQVLEEAAGITGLHARRHEAELKLRAAELNLARSEDLRLQLEATREALRRQARQAARYRGLSGHVAAAEAGYLAVLHAREQKEVEAARHALAQAEAQSAACAASAAEAGAALAAAETAMAAPRAADSAARALLERRRVEAESLADQAARAVQASLEAAARQHELEADLAEARVAECQASCETGRLSAEADRLAGVLAALPASIAEAGEALAADAARQAAAEHRAAAASRHASEAGAEQRQAGETLRDAEARATVARESLAQAVAACEEAAEALAALRPPEDAAEELRTAGQRLAQARDALALAQNRRQAAAAAHEDAMREHRRLASEAEIAETHRAAAAAAASRASQEAKRLGAAWSEADAACVAPQDLEAAKVSSQAADAQDAACEQAQALAEAGAREAADHAARLKLASQAHALASAEHRRRQAELASLAAELAQARANGDEPGALPLAQEREAGAQAKLAATEAALARLADGRARAEAQLAACRAHAASCSATLARLQAETEGVQAALGGNQAGHQSALDAITVPAGLEAALGAALAHAVEAALDPGAPQFWRRLPAMAPAVAPPGTTALSTLMEAPQALSRALASAFLLEEGQAGDRLQERLGPGQILVDRAGSAWLWDGLVRLADAGRPGATEAAASRLRQRRRLEAARAGLAACSTEAEEAAAAQRQAEHGATAAAYFEAEARESRAEAEQALRRATDERALRAASEARQTALLAALHPALERARALEDEAAARLAEANQALELLEQGGEREGAVPALRAEAAAARAEAAAAAFAASTTARQAARAAQSEAAAAFQRLSNAAAEAELRRSALGPLQARALADEAAAEASLAGATARAASARDALARDGAEAATRETLEAACRDEEAAASASDAAGQRLEEARQAAAFLDAARIQAESRLAALETLHARSTQDADAAERHLLAAHGRSEKAPCARTALKDEEDARLGLAAAREAASVASARLRDLQAESAQAQARHAEIAADLSAWRARAAEAARRAILLGQRLAAASADALALQQGAADITGRAANSGAALAAAEAAGAREAALLSTAEAAWRDGAAEEREQQTRLALAREQAARAEGGRDAAQAGLLAVLARIADRLGEAASLPDVQDCSRAAEEQARKKFDRLVRERDEMGPVNLRAEAELEALDQRLAAIEQERAELETAIAKLRGAIGHLNREGRARLTSVFEAVDANFRALFTRMMGGGRAHLAWSGSDDPLLAGLEIYAEPPGKKLSALSLLSGGEQALTALSLIFAVFRCNPAPLCVLDEVDAPLDDANVDRFCSLLDQIVQDTGTRFLVITHHQLTMSRMDRLFGVTMQERGVSRLLSVDLTAAAAIGVPVLRAAE